jgi:hypothetical protein
MRFLAMPVVSSAMAVSLCLGATVARGSAGKAVPATGSPRIYVNNTACGAQFTPSQGAQAVFEPTRLWVSCDSTLLLADIHYVSWNSRGASGSAVEQLDTCAPDCAGGKILHIPVDINLSKPRSCAGPGLTSFTHLRISPIPGKPPPAIFFKSLRTSGIPCPASR